MCGIGGIVNLNQQPISIDLVKGLSDDIHHRGPDDEGYLFTGPTTGDISKLRNAIVNPLKQLPFPLTFCHRRLAIIDLSPNGRQPMANNNEFLWITYNGELYNYLELRDSLKNDYHFKTDTDTEVILAAYEVWGKDCVNKFNGMWSFAILDTRSNEIFASRDRFGIKPFYYTKTANSFAFGSEIKQLLRFTKRSIHSETVSQFVTYGDINTSEQTCFEDIFQLMPGHCLTLNLDTSKALKVYPFYDLKEKVSPQKNTTSFQEVVEEFDHLFQDSIQLLFMTLI